MIRAITIRAALMRRALLLSLTPLCLTALFCSTALAQHNLEEAQKEWADLRFFKPGEIRRLSAGLKADLTKRECRIPMFTKWDGQHNVIQGSFLKPDSHDVAVLCLADDDMSVIVYADGNPGAAQEIRKFPADAYRLVHKQSPFVMEKRAIRDKATERLPTFDHDGIEDGPVGGRFETTYYHAGQWIDVH